MTTNNPYLLRSLLTVTVAWFAFSTSQAVFAQSSATPHVRLEERVFKDENGPFLGLGITYMSAMYQHKHDHDRFLKDMECFKKSGFNFIRILSMVAWEDLEIAPCSFDNSRKRHIEQWPDYDRQLSRLIDTAYDDYGVRVELTIFADAQIVMPDEKQRYAHIDRVLEIVKGREHKIVFLEVGNEAWQNGFPGKEGVAQLRAMGRYIRQRTPVLVALSAPYDTARETVRELYHDSDADLATLHFSRDRRKESGWYPVRECWDSVEELQMPICSNEPIGPGSSVASEDDPTRLVCAPVFAWLAGLPAYVYHTSAGVYGKEQFQDMAAITCFSHLRTILPPDTPNWNRFDAAQTNGPLKFFIERTVNGSTADDSPTSQGCLYCPGAAKENEFILAPMGLFKEGMELYTEEAVRFQVYDPSTGKIVLSAEAQQGDTFVLPYGFGAYIIKGTTEK